MKTRLVTARTPSGDYAWCLVAQAVRPGAGTTWACVTHALAPATPAVTMAVGQCAAAGLLGTPLGARTLIGGGA